MGAVNLKLVPYPKQEEFFMSQSRRTAYGGARGGGKSWAMRTKLILLALNYDGIQILLLRRTFAELRENHILPLRKLLKGICLYKEATKEFIFKNGSRIKLGYLANEADVLQYQGQAYEVIGMEEATQFTEFQYMALTESNRLSGNMNSPFTPRMYFTCNPGGVGHGWVKRLFIDKSYRNGEKESDYTFIRSTVFDNEYMVNNNPEYIDNLKSLPELRRRAMLYGDWDAFEGQYFSEFSRDIHTCAPFVIPSFWQKFAALDYGLDMTACLWFAYPESMECIYVYREVYESGLILTDAAKKIIRANSGDNIKYIAASPDLSGRRQDSGKSGFDIMSSCGLRGLMRANNERIKGWRTVREYLKLTSNGEPYIKIFSNCKNLIRTLPALTFDDKVTEDVSNFPHEITHAPDALRYGLMSLKFLPAADGKEKIIPSSDIWEDGSKPKNYVDFLTD